MAQLTLIADARAATFSKPPDGVTIPAPAAADTASLGQLYYDCHVPASLATVPAPGQHHLPAPGRAPR